MLDTGVTPPLYDARTPNEMHLQLHKVRVD